MKLFYPVLAVWCILFSNQLNASIVPSSIKPFSDPQKFEFRYEVEVPATTQSGEKVSLWIPFPIEDRYQKILSYKIDAPSKWTLGKEQKFGNRMIHLNVAPSATPTKIALNFVVERSPSQGYFLKDKEQAFNPALFTEHNQWIKLNRQIKKMSVEAVGNAKTTSAKIENMYRYIVSIMRYNKDGTGWGNGDPIWACSNKRGNCTDFHSLFISMARYQKIPARFAMGVPISQHHAEGEVPGYHCWAEAYDDSKKKWISFDASEAKKSGKTMAYFGKLPNDRIQFSFGRNIVLTPSQKGAALNYFIFPYAELDGKVLKGLKKKFTFKKI